LAGIHVQIEIAKHTKLFAAAVVRLAEPADLDEAQRFTSTR
jgi:hypothetical protein